MVRFGGVGILGLQFCAGALAAPLEPDIQRQVREATFEVVVPKPAEESIRYDKPWHELLPYQMRADKYVSVGTAFAIGDHQFVTAMHVLIAAMKRADSSDPAKYLAELPKTDYQGVTGHIRFDAKGDLAGGAVTLYQVKNGKWQTLETVQSGK